MSILNTYYWQVPMLSLPWRGIDWVSCRELLIWIWNHTTSICRLPDNLKCLGNYLNAIKYDATAPERYGCKFACLEYFSITYKQLLVWIFCVEWYSMVLIIQTLGQVMTCCLQSSLTSPIFLRYFKGFCISLILQLKGIHGWTYTGNPIQCKLES